MASFEDIRFLVVEDNGHMRQLVKSLLHAFGGKRVLTVGDGAEALGALRDFLPDLMITDFRMTPLDGVELVRLVRTGKDSPNPTLPILMLTGYTERANIAAACEAGVDHLLAKPIAPQALLGRVRQVLEAPRIFVRERNYFGPQRRQGARKVPPGAAAVLNAGEPIVIPPRLG